MSYDIYLRGPRCRECGREIEGNDSPELPNPTYNLTPIFDLSLSGETLPNSNLTDLLNPALRDRFVALEPPNKWGVLADAVWTFEKLIAAAEKCPDMVWEVR